MSYVPIYLPDGDISVQWYVTEDKRVEGVESVSTSWVRHEVGVRRDTGFKVPNSALDAFLRSGLSENTRRRCPDCGGSLAPHSSHAGTCRR